MPKVTSHTSHIEGEGLFAEQSIQKGQRIQYIQGEFKRKINKTEADVMANPDWIGVSKQKWLDPAMPFKRLNHSCEPNAGIRGTKTLVALRDIKEGEEITFDYSTTEVDKRWHLPAKCACGSKKCRKDVGSIQSLSKGYIRKCIELNIIPRGILKVAQSIV